MAENFFIKKDQRIIGPFERHVVINMLNNGTLSAEDRVSCDKKLWQVPYAALNLIVPDNSPTRTQINIQVDPQTEFDAASAVFSEQQPTEQVEEIELDRSFKRICSDTIASLGNGSKYLYLIWQKGSNCALLAGGLAAITGILLTILSCVCFSSYYNLPPVVVYVRSLLMSLLAGAIFWLANVLIRLLVSPPPQPGRVEADFLCAMYGMMNISTVLLICNAMMFLFNKTLFTMSMMQLTAAVSFALLPIGFLLANTFAALRLHLMFNSNISAGMASLLATLEIWLTIPLFIVLQYTVYSK